MGIPASHSMDQPRVRVGDVFAAPSRSKAARSRYDTNLSRNAWGHMLFVLGPTPDYPGYWDVRTVSTASDTLGRTLTLPQITKKMRAIDEYIPFYPLPQGENPLQLQLGNGRRFLRDSYLRIAEDYWIEESGLKKRLAYVPLDGPLSVKSLLNMIREKHLQAEAERRMLEEAALVDMRLDSKLIDVSLDAWNRLEIGGLPDVQEWTR